MDQASNSEQCNSKTDENTYNKVSTEYSHDIIKKILKVKCNDPKSKISEEAVELMKAIIKALAVETAIRCAKQAILENKTVVTVNHIEVILPQLMLDFP